MLYNFSLMKNNKALLTIFLIVFIDLLGFGIILPLLPFIAQKYLASPLTIGILTASYSFFQFIFTPILGRLSDRYGRKKILIISQLGSMIGYLILALANNLPLIFLSRIIDGITGGNISIAQAYIADVTSKENRAKGMGLIGAAFGLGFIFGPAIGGLLSKISFSAPAFLAAFVSLVTIFMTFFLLKETVDIKKAAHSKRTSLNWQNIAKILVNYPLNLLIFSFFFVNLSFSSFQGIFPLYSEKKFTFGPQENGWIFTYIGILVVIIQLKIMPALVSKFHEKKVMKIGLFLLSLGFFLLPFSDNIFQLGLFLTVIPFGSGLFNPTIMALVSEKVSKYEYGEVMGVMQAFGSIGRILGPVIAGELFGFSISFPFYFSFVVVFVLFIFSSTI